MNKMIENFNKHGFKAKFFETREDAIKFILSNVKNEFISFGGSMTLKELNLYELLKNNGNKVLWHWENDSLSEARNANVFFTSANAITEDGLILNIDGTGNRVSMMMYGPKECYIIVGKNKISKDMADAYKRCKEVACVLNAKRLNLDLPCVKLNKCVNCNSDKRICRAITILERPTAKMEVSLIIINENLGY